MQIIKIVRAPLLQIDDSFVAMISRNRNVGILRIDINKHRNQSGLHVVPCTEELLCGRTNNYSAPVQFQTAM